MSESNTDRAGGTAPPLGRRPRRVVQDALVREASYAPESDLPWLVEPAIERVDLVQWAQAHRSHLDAKLCERGAILFRGFEVRDVDDFRRLVNATSDGLVKYTYRASPRAEVGDRVYTSTDYPADQSIFPHNEHAFSPVFPRKLFFYCDTPPSRGGETPLGSGRAVRDAIAPAVRRKFHEKGVMYLRNYGKHMGLPWETVFQTTDRAAVEAYCREHDITWRWRPDGGLSTRQVGPAFVRHPVTSECLWFNHATFFHVTTLAPALREALLASYAETELPNNTYYGDGSEIEAHVLEELRAAYARPMVSFPWRKGDVLMVDNLLVTHARNPYEGPRRILVGMAEPIAAGAVRLAPDDALSSGVSAGDPEWTD
jgi:alpha-ketoglutarate-dependent taurine dioxygenase